MNFLDTLSNLNDRLMVLVGGADSVAGRLTYWGEWFIGCLVAFAILSRIFPSIKQRAVPDSLKIDAIYWFFGPFFYAPIFRFFIIFYSASLAVRGMNSSVHGWVSTHLPVIRTSETLSFTDMLQTNVLIQALLILLISDFFQYWLHRFFHRDPLWKYHAIHHSPQHIDWITSVRFHPINIILYSTSINAFVAVMGFDVEAFLILQPFNMIYSPLVHANLKWNYGPFKYILASPVFHRWHHTHQDEGGNKNFAPTFSFLDVIFGTFYMPKDRQPERFGIEGNPVPESFLGQMAYPFRQKPKG